MLLPFSIYSVAKQNWLPNLNYDDKLVHSVSLEGCNVLIIYPDMQDLMYGIKFLWNITW